MIKIKIISIVLILFIFNYSFSMADGVPGFEGPYIQEDIDISIENITIKIFDTKIHFEYKIFNTYEYEIEKKFALIIPSHTWTIPRSTIHDESFKDTTLRINDIPVKLIDKTRCYFEGVDITDFIDDLKIDKSVGCIKKFSKYIEDNNSIKEILLKNRYIDTVIEEQDGVRIVQYAPRWLVVPKYIFKCKFESKKYTTIAYSYILAPDVLYEQLNIINQKLSGLGQDISDIKRYFNDKSFNEVYDCTWIKQNISSFGASTKLKSLDIYASTSKGDVKKYVSVAVGTNMQSIDPVYNSTGLNSTELHIKDFILEGVLVFFTAGLHK